jgi:hypothetical protein
MEDLSLEEIKQLVIFYKQKNADLEFNLLQLQIKLNRITPLQDTVELQASSRSASGKK